MSVIVIRAVFSGFDHGKACTDHEGLKAVMRLSLTRSGLCTFKFSCLSDFCEIQCLCSENNIQTVGYGSLLWNQGYLWLART